MSKNKVGPILRQLGVTYHGPNYGYLGAHGAAVSGIDVAWTWYNGKKAKNVYFWGPNGQIMSPFCLANLLCSNRIEIEIEIGSDVKLFALGTGTT